MDGIPFEKVSLDEMRAATASTRPSQDSSTTNWMKFRSPDPEPRQLSRQAYEWFASLPRSVRPNLLARSYPRIANRIADVWKRPLQCERYLDELMLDKRGGRHGFPLEIAAEIASLKAHFNATSGVVHYGVWGNRIGAD